MRRIVSCLMVGVAALLAMLVLKRVGFLEFLSKDIAELWIADDAVLANAMPVPSVLIDLFGGAIAAGMAWVCLEMRSPVKQAAVFVIGLLLVLTGPAVWAQGGIIVDAAPILVGLVVGLIGGQICVGLTWEDEAKEHFAGQLQNRCETWVCERLRDAGALTGGKPFPAVVLGLRALGDSLLPERLHYGLQRSLKSSGAIVDDTQLQNLIGVIPAAENPSAVARLAYDAIELLKNEVASASEEGGADGIPKEFLVVVHFGDMRVLQVERLDKRSDIAVGGAALTDVLTRLYFPRDGESADEWTVVYGEEFVEIDSTIKLSAVRGADLAGAPSYTLEKRPEDLPEPEPEPEKPVLGENAADPVVTPRTIRAKLATAVVEEKVVTQAPRRIKLTVRQAVEVPTDEIAKG